MGECIMKKLLLLLISFGFICSAQANERVNLSCTFYESFAPSIVGVDWLEVKDKEELSLTIFPNTSEFIFDFFEGEYKTEGNRLLFGSEIGANRYASSLDRVTAVINHTVYETNPSFNDGKEYVFLKYRGKCKVIKNLF